VLEVPFHGVLCARYNGGVLFRIREFHKADFETLWRIDQACFDPQLAYSQREMAYYMRHPGAFTLVAESGPEDQAIREGSSKRERTDLDSGASTRGILGFIIAETRRQSGHIITIDVVAQARRSGTGSALLQAAEDKLREGGAVMVTLEVAVNNEPAIRFYKQKRYFVEKTVRGYYSNHLDALVMTKSLEGAG
jgi:ribosomal-protein-alanine N-acetyltransferase